MPSWSGNKTNPAPNNVRESIEKSEKTIGDNRALHVRRDTDNQKNITISLYDIDEAMIIHLDRMNLQVVDAGQVIKVPFYYASPELWKASKNDGYLRDKQGKLILPVMVLKRTNSGDDESLKFFHRYLQSSVIKKYSSKNEYTQFSVLAGQNAPVNEVYNIVFPSHMKLTYHFIIWTETIEQMNPLVERLRFDTGDYWGSKKGFRFRTQIEGFAHTTELQVGEDRIVKTEFDMITHGYILPEVITTLENQRLTTEKFFTPKKFIVNTEVVSTGYNMDQLDENREKWRNPQYPNLPKDEYIQPPGMVVTDNVEDKSTIISDIISTLKANTKLKVVPVPLTITSVGSNGEIAFDSQYFYIYSNGSWRRTELLSFV